MEEYSIYQKEDDNSHLQKMLGSQKSSRSSNTRSKCMLASATEN